MPSRDEELNQMKTQIDLRALAASMGYERDRKNSSANSTCMRRGNDKIFIGVGYTGQWIYWSVNDHSDNGTIVDFVTARQNLYCNGKMDLGAVRKELRPWIGVTGGVFPEYHRFGGKPKPVEKDRQAVLCDFAAADTLDLHRGLHPYLCNNRCIPASLLNSERFCDRVRIDQRGNALFGHYDQDGLCGIEIKNLNFTSFHKQGTKGLWAVGKKEDDEQLVIAETAIDALSHAALFPHPKSRYVSTAGAMSSKQPGLVNQAIRNMPEGSRIVLAVDNDDGGNDLIEAITAIYNNVRDTLGRRDLQLQVHRPEILNDWNDELKSKAPLPYPDPL